MSCCFRKDDAAACTIKERQYGDWLRADMGKNKSKTLAHKPPPPNLSINPDSAMQSSDVVRIDQDDSTRTPFNPPAADFSPIISLTHSPITPPTQIMWLI